WTPEEACKRLEDAGADVVGLNCARGPATIMPLVERIRGAVSCHVAALPVPYRTTDAEPTFQSLTDPGYHDFPNGRPLPTAPDRPPLPARPPPPPHHRSQYGAFPEAVRRPRRPLHGRLLRPRPPPHQGGGRSPRPHAARQQVLRRHVQARVLRHARARPTGVP